VQGSKAGEGGRGGLKQGEKETFHSYESFFKKSSGKFVLSKSFLPCTPCYPCIPCFKIIMMIF
ncbi:MAG: hypothetical protein AAFX46_02910, partial [Cyanobacteria bacterium J06636_27]